MKQFTRPNLDVIRVEIEQALKAVADRNGVRFSLGSMGFTANDFRAHLRCEIVNTVVGTNTDTPGVSGTLDNMGNPVVGSRFISAGKEYEVVDYKWNRLTYPVSSKRIPDGKRFKFTLETVKLGLQK